MLVISTVTKKAYIALSIDGKTLTSSLDADCRQSENVLKEIDSLLEKSGLRFSDIKDIGVVVGPGSFTGIRIGIALVKGLCANDQKKKIIPISTLDLMAQANIEQNNPKENFVCVLNALSGRLFVCEYDKNGKRLSKERMIMIDEFLEIKKNCVSLLEEDNIAFASVKITPDNLLSFAQKLKEEKKFTSANSLAPIYIRKSQAEENL